MSRGALLCVVVILGSRSLPARADDLLRDMPFDQPTAVWIAANVGPVQRALSLSGDQVNELSKLGETAKDQHERQNVEKRVAALLSKAQFQRLQQIAWQARPDEALRSAEVAKALGLREEQQKQIERLWQEAQTALVDDLRRMRFRSERERNRFIRARLAEVAEQMRAVLTAEQQERFHTLLGKPFDFEEHAAVRPK
jgi:hypothetical protein